MQSPWNSLKPISYVNYYRASGAIWNNAPSPDVTMNVTCRPVVYLQESTPDRQYRSRTDQESLLTLRFTNDLRSSHCQFLLPEAYAAFSSAYPSVVNWV